MIRNDDDRDDTRTPTTASRRVFSLNTLPLALTCLVLASGVVSTSTWAEDDEAAGEPAAEAVADTVMTQPIDGSDEEAFKASVARVKAEASPEDYDLFQRALGMMRAYDLAVRSNPAVLAQRCDGKTPEEVITAARERWRF